MQHRLSSKTSSLKQRDTRYGLEICFGQIENAEKAESPKFRRLDSILNFGSPFRKISSEVLKKSCQYFYAESRCVD